MNEMTEEDTFDVVIIGAGINGAGIARDASLRGLKVLLVDKGDIASGTSSYSTRLIHGGLRYLEHGEFALVRESLREREILLRIAPHLVRPLPILIPIYRDSSRGPAKVRAGMIAYDLLSLNKSLPRHRMLTRDETLRQIPGMNSDGIRESVIYYDAQVEFAERLVLENVLSAIENGARVLSHAKVENFESENNRVVAVRYRNKRSNRTETVKTRLVVNAAGPWLDQVLENVSGPNDRLLGGTKGSHIVVAPFSGAGAMAMYVEAQTDKRPFFIIPWNGNYLIGTTDVHFENDPDAVHSELWEIDYLLQETNRIFPNAKLTRSEVLFTYSGIRPLPFTKNESERRITRKHFIKQHRLTNLWSIVGGKLTTYRSLAEECVDLLCRKLGLVEVRSKTAELPLPGAREFVRATAELTDQTPLSMRLLRIYGSRALEVVEFCKGKNALSEHLGSTNSVLSGEVVFSFEKELALNVVDCLMRRTMLGLESDLGVSKLEAAAKVAQETMGWSNQRATDEIQNYLNYIQRMSVDSSQDIDPVG